METRLSSKGQIVIPKAIRERLDLQKGTPFRIRVEEGAIVLEPLAASPVDALYGRYAGDDFLTELEAEHRQELVDDDALCP
jgi:AbrB family looped-hinge helix DNA binding protein